MNPLVTAESQHLVEKAMINGQVGTIADFLDLATLNHELSGMIPAWYIELITTFSLCGLELGWQADEPFGDDDGVSRLEWFDVAGIRSESLELHPGSAIISRGYLCVAGCLHGSGDQYFIPTDEGDNLPLYQVNHDAGDEADTILASGRRLIAPTLSGFFRLAVTSMF